jgi:hypothetical protein
VGRAEIRPSELIAPWIYDRKFSAGTQFIFEMLPFTVGEDDDLERPTQEQGERRTTTIGFEFPRGLKNSVTTLQVAVRQLATTNLIDSPARPQIGTLLMTTRSSGLALSEI